MIWASGIARDFMKFGRSEACPVIDMHGHMGPWRAIYLPRAATDLMIRSMDASGVRMLVFCHHAALLCPDIGNAANVEAVRRFPDRLRAYLAINPNYPDAMARDLADYDKYSDVYVGLKLLAGYHGVAWDAPVYERAWRFADERRLLVLGHTWQGSSLDGPEQVRKAAARYRNVRLLCGHAIHGAWDEAVAIARDLPNVYLELTAVLDTDRGAVEKICRAGLSERVVFGTDLPWFDQHQGIGAILSAEITDEDRHNILHRNAERLLRGLAGLAF